MTETNNLTHISKQKILSIALPCLLAWTFSYLATNVFRDYGFGLFIWLPLVLGATSTLILAYKSSVPRLQLRNNAYLTLLIFCIGLLAFAWEGIICLIMAAPIGFVFTYFGFLIGFHFSKSNLKRQTPTAIILLVLSAPSLMAFEDTLKETDDLRSVVTTIEINATPEKVLEKRSFIPTTQRTNRIYF